MSTSWKRVWTYHFLTKNEFLSWFSQVPIKFSRKKLFSTFSQILLKFFPKEKKKNRKLIQGWPFCTLSLSSTGRKCVDMQFFNQKRVLFSVFNLLFCWKSKRKDKLFSTFSQILLKFSQKKSEKNDSGPILLDSFFELYR